jgi:hypothetical protein
MQLQEKYDARQERYPLYKVKKMYEKTLLDGNFQRYGGSEGGSGWTLSNACDYISEFLLGGTFNDIINVSVPDALRYAKEIKDEESIDYFQNVESQGFEYISIDGNNTASYLTSFVSGNEKIKVSLSDYNTSKSFNELTEDEKNAILYMEQANVVILRRITITEMCRLFRKLNTSTKLNNQEYRQARWSLLSKSIRKHANDNKDFFTGFIFLNPADLDKRSHEEMVAQLAIKVENNYNVPRGSIAKSGLDKFYSYNDALKDKTEKTLSTILSVCSETAKEIGYLSRRIKKGQVHNFWDLLYVVCVEKKFEIVNQKAFFNWFLEKDAHFSALSDSVSQGEQEKKSYTFWTNRFSAYTTKIKKLLTSCFLNELSLLIDDQIIKFKRSNKDSFTFEQKLKAWNLQERRTRTGDYIKVVDLYIGGVYEADHVVSVKDGGATSIENCELMAKKENRIKGSKSNEPYFDYQIA